MDRTNQTTVVRVVDIDLPDFSRMTTEEFIAWEPPEPDPYRLLEYPLQTDAWRRAFLHDYYWVGESALFVAVAHVWATLAPPRSWRCTMMGLMSGSGGTGKAALVNTLKQFLAEMLAVDHPFPPRTDFPSLEAWNDAAQRVFAADDADRDALIARYAAILNGRAAPLAKRRSQVIVGPWKRSQNRITAQHYDYSRLRDG